MFLQGSLPVLTHLKLLIQRSDPIIHIMYDALRRTMSVMIGWLFTPPLEFKFNSKGLKWEFFKIFFISQFSITLIRGVLCAFLVLYWQLDRRITRYSGHWFLYNLEKKHTLREKCPYSVLLWSAFSRNWTEYGKTQNRITPNTEIFCAVIVSYTSFFAEETLNLVPDKFFPCC